MKSTASANGVDWRVEWRGSVATEEGDLECTLASTHSALCYRTKSQVEADVPMDCSDGVGRRDLAPGLSAAVA